METIKLKSSVSFRFISFHFLDWFMPMYWIKWILTNQEEHIKMCAKNVSTIFEEFPNDFWFNRLNEKWLETYYVAVRCASFTLDWNRHIVSNYFVMSFPWASECNESHIPEIPGIFHPFSMSQ